MWIIQICVGSFWLFIGTVLLFRESMFWASVENIDWFRNRFGSPSSHKWERFCRDAGIISFTTGCLLFLSLPYGVGVLGIVLFVPPLILFR